MPWVNEWPDFDYRFLSSGELEFRGRGGRYFLVSGCSAVGWFEFGDRLEELAEICREAPDGVTIEHLYLEHPRFQYLCNRCLELNGIEPDWVTPHMLEWLLFNRVEDGQPIVAPLQHLNKLPEPRYPKPKKPTREGEDHFDRASILAAIASYCGGDLSKAQATAKVMSLRELTTVLDELAWQSKSPQEKHKARQRTWAEKERAKARAEMDAMRAGILKSRGVKTAQANTTTTRIP